MASISTSQRLDIAKSQGNLTVIEDGILKSATDFSLCPLAFPDIIKKIFLIADLSRLERIEFYFNVVKIATIWKQDYIGLLGNELKFTLEDIPKICFMSSDIKLRVFYKGKGSEHSKIYICGEVLPGEIRSKKCMEKGEIIFPGIVSRRGEDLRISYENSRPKIPECLSENINYYPSAKISEKEYVFTFPIGIDYTLKNIFIEIPENSSNYFSYSMTIDCQKFGCWNFVSREISSELLDKFPRKKYEISFIDKDDNPISLKLYKILASSVTFSVFRYYFDGKFKFDPIISLYLEKVPDEKVKEDIGTELLVMKDGITCMYKDGIFGIYSIKPKNL